MNFSFKTTPTVKWYLITIAGLLLGTTLADLAGQESAWGFIGFVGAFFSGLLLLGLIFRSVTEELSNNKGDE